MCNLDFYDENRHHVLDPQGLDAVPTVYVLKREKKGSPRHSEAGLALPARPC